MRPSEYVNDLNYEIPFDFVGVIICWGDLLKQQ